MGYNQVEKLNLLADYPGARSEAFLLYIINSGFAATGVALVNTNRVLSKLNISLRTLHHQEGALAAAAAAADLPNSYQRRLGP